MVLRSGRPRGRPPKENQCQLQLTNLVAKKIDKSTLLGSQWRFVDDDRWKFESTSIFSIRKLFRGIVCHFSGISVARSVVFCWSGSVLFFYFVETFDQSGGRSVMFRQSDTRLTNLIVVLLDGTGGVGVTKLFIYIVCERRIHAGPIFELQSFIMGPI